MTALSPVSDVLPRPARKLALSASFGAVPVLSVLQRMTVDYGDRQETIDGGRAHQFAPGHLLTVQTDCEAVESTPTEALEQTMEAVRRNNAAGGTLGG